MSHLEQGPLASYNSLQDKHLAGYFANTRMKKHLIRSGLVNKKGGIISETTYRLNMAKKEHKKHVKDLLATAIVHKALDAERERQHEIRRRLDEIYKTELVKRVQRDRARKGDEDIVPLLSPREKSSRPKSRRKRSKNSSLSSGSPREEPRMLSPSELHFDEETGKLYYRIDKNHIQEVSGPAPDDEPSPYTRERPLSSSCPVPAPPSSSPPRRARTATPGRRKPKLQRFYLLSHTEPAVAHRIQLQSMAEVTMKFLGSNVHINNSIFSDEKLQEVMVLQQHCGGNTICLFRELLPPHTVFSFISRRHRGAPFGLTFYIDGVQDTRLSACCEYKHKPGHRLGGKNGHFAFVKVEGAAPCYRCQVAASMKHRKKYNKQEEEAAAEEGEEEGDETLEIIIAKLNEKEEPSTETPEEKMDNSTQTTTEEDKVEESKEKTDEPREDEGGYEEEDFEDDEEKEEEEKEEEEKEDEKKEDRDSDSSSSSSSDSDSSDDEDNDKNGIKSAEDKKDSNKEVDEAGDDKEEADGGKEIDNEAHEEDKGKVSEEEDEGKVSEEEVDEEKDKGEISDDGDKDKRENEEEILEEEDVKDKEVPEEDESEAEEVKEESASEKAESPRLEEEIEEEQEDTLVKEINDVTDEAKEEPTEEEKEDGQETDEERESEARPKSAAGDHKKVSFDEDVMVISEDSRGSEDEPEEYTQGDEDTDKDVEDEHKKEDNEEEKLDEGDKIESGADETAQEETDETDGGKGDQDETEDKDVVDGDTKDDDKEKDEEKEEEEEKELPEEFEDSEEKLEEADEKMDEKMDEKTEKGESEETPKEDENESLPTETASPTGDKEISSPIPSDGSDDEGESNFVTPISPLPTQESDDEDNELNLDPGNDPDMVATDKLPDQALKAVGVEPGEKVDGPVTPLVEGNKDVDLTSVALSPEQVEEVANLVETKEDVDTLTLRNAEMNDEAIEKIAEAIKKSDLKMLNFNVNKIGPEGAQHVASSLKENKTIKMLLLHGNPLGDEGVKHIVDALVPSKDDEAFSANLKNLDLGDCGLGEQGAQHISRLIEHNTSVTDLNISGNHFTTEGWKQIADALKVNTTLKAVSLDFNKIGDEEAILIAEGLKGNTCLRSVDLEGNRIGDEGGMHLLEAVKANSRIVDITLMPVNNISQEILDEIKNAIEGRVQRSSIDSRESASEDTS